MHFGTPPTLIMTIPWPRGAVAVFETLQGTEQNSHKITAFQLGSSADTAEGHSLQEVQGCW